MVDCLGPKRNRHWAQNLKDYDVFSGTSVSIETTENINTEVEQRALIRNLHWRNHLHRPVVVGSTIIDRLTLESPYPTATDEVRRVVGRIFFFFFGFKTRPSRALASTLPNRFAVVDIFRFFRHTVLPSCRCQF